LLTPSTQQRLDELTRASTDGTLRQFLIAPTPDTREAARRTLASLATTSAQTIVAWNSGGQRIDPIT
jgi:hypothetical protein